jgi:hypothetical protein
MTGLETVAVVFGALILISIVVEWLDGRNR